ncbi:MAG: hypothetical protein HY221_02095, partial [Candidatus Sungbacteria bacterium]|nr:hypothetical protein [Candidatus Sungbacteria bacterium]
MPSKRLGINRDQWKQALLKVIGSQTETLLNKGDIITNAAALVGYTPSPANAMARAALLELENERKVERVRGGHDSAKRYRLVREWRAEQEDAPSSLDAPTSG